MAVDRTCARCAVVFSVNRGGPRKFCDDCISVDLACQFCGSAFVMPRRLYEFGDSKRGQYCSRKCRSADVDMASVSIHRQLKGDPYLAACGRWKVRTRSGAEYYARAVMAAHIGRELEPGECVHHINEDITDDRIENLELVDRSEHMKIHRARQLGRAA